MGINNSIDSATSNQDFGGDIKLTGLSPGTASQIVYIDPTSGVLTREAAPSGGFNPASSYNGSTLPAISGDWVHTGNFSINNYTSIPGTFTVDSNDINFISEGGITFRAQGDHLYLFANQGGDLTISGSMVTLEGQDFINLTCQIGAINLSSPRSDINLVAGTLNSGLPGNIKITSTLADIILTSGNVVNISAQSDINIGTPSGSITLVGTTQIALSAATIVMGLPFASKSNVVFYDTTTNQLSYGSSPGGGFDPSANQTITGNWSFNNGISVYSPGSNVEINTNNGSINLNAGNGFTAGDVSLLTFVGNINLTTVSGNIILLSAADASLSSTSGRVSISSSLGINLSSASVALPTIPNATKANILYWDSTNYTVSYGAAPSGAFSTATDYKTGSTDGPILGDWEFTGGFVVNSNNVADVSIIAPKSNIFITAGDLAAVQPGKMTLKTCYDDMFLDCGNNSTISAANQMIVGSGSDFTLSSGGTITFTCQYIATPNLITGTTPEIIYYDIATDRLSRGPVPTGLAPIEVTGTSQSLSPGNKYIINSPGNVVALQLPVTAPFGSEIEIVWQDAVSWSISQNNLQAIRVGNLISSTGTGGSVSSTVVGDSLKISCTVADTSFTATSFVGNLNVV